MNKKCDWAYCMFEQWINKRNKATEGDKSQSQIVNNFLEMSNWEMVYSITRFIIEVRKKYGTEYPA